MPALVPTLTSSLAKADDLFNAGRTSAARRAFGDLLERAQDKSDRPTEVIARTMLAWCALRARDWDGAREALAEAGAAVDPRHTEAYGRYRRVLVRLATETGAPDSARNEARDYLTWAEVEDRAADALDACLLMAGLSEVDERVDWLERGIEFAIQRGATEDLGRAFNELGAAQDQLGAHDEALAAYEQALRWHQERARAHPQDLAVRRSVIAATWAVGASACKTEAWPLAQESLESALIHASADDSCADLIGWIRADLARVYEAAGDVVGARHQMVAALEIAREQELAALWPERYADLLDQADALDVS